MSLVSAAPLIEKAFAGHYAVAAINTQGGNYDIVRAIVETAEEEKSPVMLAAYEKNLEYSGFEWFGEYGRWVAMRASVPVVLHLDHASSFDAIMLAIRNGFTSVMIDYSTRPLKENIEITKEVIRVARPLGIAVEAEIGELQRLDQTGTVSDNKNMVNPDEVAEFLGACRPDMLAIGIGNAHGFYKGKPDIRVDLLKKVHSLAPDLPLVLHGTTGIPDDVILECIANGIAKVNYGTIIRSLFLEFLQKGAEGAVDHKGHVWKVNQFAKDKIKDECRRILARVGSMGKA